MRWKGQDAGVNGGKYNLWRSGKGDGVGVRIMVKEELSEKVVEVRMVSDRVLNGVIFL